VIAITAKLATGDMVREIASPLEGSVKQVLTAVLVGVAIAAAGLAAEAVFAKPIYQSGIGTRAPQAHSQPVHVLDPIIVDGD
jgi:hypothetical protein